MAAGVLYPTMSQAGEWNDHAAMQPRGMFIGTPEIYFTKRIDNSRVVKVTDPKRRREMMTFGITLAMLFSAGDGVFVAAFQRHRVRLQDRAAQSWSATLSPNPTAP